ncbi:Sulfotransferase [Mactra antiquata]
MFKRYVDKELVSIMALLRRKKFSVMLFMMVLIISAIILTSFYSDNDVTIINLDTPILISANPKIDKIEKSNIVDESSFSSIKARLDHRKKVLADKCNANKKVTEYHSVYAHEPSRHLMISNKKRLMYCFLPKVANTNFRRVFLGLEGFVPKDKVPSVSGYDVYFTLDNTFKYLKDFNQQQQKEMLKNFKKFIVVREPLERLLSGYRNKFFHPNQAHRDEYHNRVARFYREHPSLKKKHNMDTNFQKRSITFKEFLIYWSDSFEVKEYVNEHFTPNSELCNPCSYDFDYIIRYENLDEETKYVFDDLNLGIQFPSRNDNYSSIATSALVDEFYTSVDSWILRKVWSILQWDFNYFSYTLPVWYLEKIKT